MHNASLLPSPSRVYAVPLAVLCLLFFLCYELKADFMLASFWYQLQCNSWALQHFWLTEELLHRGVRACNQWVIALLLLHFTLQGIRRKYRERKKLLQPQALLQATSSWTVARQTAHAQLLVSLILSLAGIALLKKLIPMDCPWDLQQFGGSQTFTGLFSSWPANRAPNACFPAGHASIGYAWLGLYFFCLQLYPTLARLALVCSITLGISLGLVQQLRGAHFMSHDIATAAWCWTMACLCAYWPAFRSTLTRKVRSSNALNPSTNTARGTSI